MARNSPRVHYRLNTILPLLLCAALSPQTLAAQTISIDPDSVRLAVAGFFESYEDSSESLTINDVLAPTFGVKFISHSRDILHFGITSSAYWLRLNFDWSEMEPGAQKVLEFGPPKIVAGVVHGGIELYVIDQAGGVRTSYFLGKQDSEREIKTLGRSFAILFDAEFGDQIYMRITSARPLRLPITLWEVDEFQQQNVRSDTLLGLQYGILLAMIFYNLILFSLSEKRSTCFTFWQSPPKPRSSS
jgi:hypothetical protein